MYLIRFFRYFMGGVMKVHAARMGYCLGILGAYAITMIALVHCFWAQSSVRMPHDDAVALVLVKGIFFGILLGIGSLAASIYGHCRLFNRK
jgi:hypothetical protein